MECKLFVEIIKKFGKIIPLTSLSFLRNLKLEDKVTNMKCVIFLSDEAKNADNALAL